MTGAFPAREISDVSARIGGIETRLARVEEREESTRNWRANHEKVFASAAERTGLALEAIRLDVRRLVDARKAQMWLFGGLSGLVITVVAGLIGWGVWSVQIYVRQAAYDVVQAREHDRAEMRDEMQRQGGKP